MIPVSQYQSPKKEPNNSVDYLDSTVLFLPTLPWISGNPVGNSSGNSRNKYDYVIWQESAGKGETSNTKSLRYSKWHVFSETFDKDMHDKRSTGNTERMTLKRQIDLILEHRKRKHRIDEQKLKHKKSPLFDNIKIFQQSDLTGAPLHRDSETIVSDDPWTWRRLKHLSWPEIIQNFKADLFPNQTRFRIPKDLMYQQDKFNLLNWLDLHIFHPQPVESKHYDQMIVDIPKRSDFIIKPTDWLDCIVHRGADAGVLVKDRMMMDTFRIRAKIVLRMPESNNTGLSCLS